MPLVTAQQYGGLTPDVLGAQQRGLQTRVMSQELANRERLRGLEEQGLATRQRALGVPGEVPEGETQEAARLRMIATDPTEAKEFLGTIGINTQQKLEDASRFATEALAAPSEEIMVEMINTRAREIGARGGDPTETLMLLEQTPEQRQASLTGVQKIALTALQRETFTAKERAAEGGVSQVQRSDILPDGTVQLVRKDGTVEVVSPDEATEALVKQSREYGAGLQGLRAGERAGASESVKQSVAAFKQLAPIRKNIVNIDKAIRAIDEGAKTGAVEGRLPSIRAASVKLDNVQAQMGLDVIGSTTFGALSESELAFALSSALPKGLNEQELKKWLIEKRDTQKKLAGYLEETAIYLGTPGNEGIPGFIKMKKAEQASRDQAQATEAGVLPEGVTEDDVTETMRANNMTRQEVLDRLAQ